MIFQNLAILLGGNHKYLIFGSPDKPAVDERATDENVKITNKVPHLEYACNISNEEDPPGSAKWLHQWSVMYARNGQMKFAQRRCGKIFEEIASFAKLAKHLAL